jgi:hypothetical protein
MHCIGMKLMYDNNDDNDKYKPDDNSTFEIIELEEKKEGKKKGKK